MLTHFLLSAARAVIEMIGLCMLGQGAMYLLAGRRRVDNPIYQLFSLITKPARRMVGTFFSEKTKAQVVGITTFVILLLLWIGLAFLRKFV